MNLGRYVIPAAVGATTAILVIIILGRPPDGVAVRPAPGSNAVTSLLEPQGSERPADDGTAVTLERRIALLEERLLRSAEREADLERRLQELVEALRSGGAAQPFSAAAVGEATEPPEEMPGVDHDVAPIDANKSPMQRALEKAGVDAETAEHIKRRGDALAMAEVYLRDQAMREGWLDSPRFAEEMAAIDAQQTSLRDELGEDLYDRYLFAQGRPNRVIVNDVMFQSVAEEVGLQTGDMIVRYGDAFLFAPDELVTQTHGGLAGETVTLEVMRAGESFQVEVPRGPLGLRIGPAQDDPDAG